MVHQSWIDHWCLQPTASVSTVYCIVHPLLLVILVPALFHREVTPSFILMAIQGDKVVTYVYELDGDSVVVSKTEFSKAT